MDAADVDRWFGGYLETFAACGRGESPTSSVLDHYGVPLLLTTDDGVLALTTADEVVAMAQSQVDGMLAAGYHHSDVLDSEVTPLNAVTALYRGSFSRRHDDGSEISRLAATYLITGTGDARRISAIALHPASQHRVVQEGLHGR